jgi:hypothetical protein
MKTLNEIIDWYGSDKNLSGYTPYYIEIFESIRNNKIELLEIGIGTIIVSAQSSMANTSIKNYKPGASLRSWQEYFSNDLYCEMINDAHLMLGEKEINVLYGDFKNSRNNELKKLIFITKNISDDLILKNCEINLKLLGDINF